MTPKKITDQLEHTLGHTGRPRQLRDAIEDILLNFFDQPVTKSAELSESLSKKVANEIEKRVVDSLESGTIPIVSLRPNREVIHGSLFIFPDDNDSISSTKILRRNATRLLSVIRNLSFNEFEVFGGAVLRELGCPSPEVTPHSTDQGIDFYGELSVGDILGENLHVKHLMHSVRMVIVGQAKRYQKNPIGSGDVRELVGTLSLARTSTFSKQGIDFFDQIVLRPNTPTLAILIATGDFTKGARHLAKESGILLYSGFQLAVFLADCQVGIRIEGDNSTFDESDFRAWMERQS